MSKKSNHNQSKGATNKKTGQGAPIIVDITDKTFSVTGATQIKDELKGLGGKYSAKHKGYNFSHKKREEIDKFLSGFTGASPSHSGHKKKGMAGSASSAHGSQSEAAHQHVMSSKETHPTAVGGKRKAATLAGAAEEESQSGSQLAMQEA